MMLAFNCCRVNAPQCVSQAFPLKAAVSKEANLNFQLGWGSSGLLGTAVCAKASTRLAQKNMAGLRRLAPVDESFRRHLLLEVGRQRSIMVGAAVGAAAGAASKVKTRRGPRLKIIRRLGPLPGLTRKISKKSNSGRSTSSRAGARPKKKPTQYGIRLMEKQKLLFNYGLREGQLLRLVKIARRAKGSTGQVLLQLLEMRLDNIVYRLGFAPTIPAARQLVSHGHITVNGRRVNIASYRCKPTETIAVREKEASKKLVTENVGSGSRRAKPPSHLNVSASGLSGTIKQVISRQAVGVKVNELLVVEYYSRMA